MKTSIVLLVLIVFITPGFAVAGNVSLDSQIAEAGEFFSGKLRGDIDVVIPSKLDRKKLNYSLASLDSVSSWLNVIRSEGMNTNSEGMADSIIWTGAYVGEVIKRCAPELYMWIG